MNTSAVTTNIYETFSFFSDDPVITAEAFGDGHINDTYLVRSKKGSFVLQRIQRGVDLSKLKHNYDLYSPVFNEAGWLYPK